MKNPLNKFNFNWGGDAFGLAIIITKTELYIMIGPFNIIIDWGPVDRKRNG